jgi:hypothetical protein
MISDLDRFFAELETAELSTAAQRQTTTVEANTETQVTTSAGIPFSDPEEHPCWHCGGTGQCDCISCGRFKSHTIWVAGRCVPCKARGRQNIQ